MSHSKIIPFLVLLVGVGLARGQEPAPLAWLRLDHALEQAKSQNRPILVYVQAAWCGPCRRMEQDVFPAMHPLLERLIRTRIDYDDHERLLHVGQQALSPFDWARHFGVDATPGFVLLAPDGMLIAQSTGYLDPKAFSLFLAYAVTGAYRHTSFKTYAEQTQPPGF